MGGGGKRRTHRFIKRGGTSLGIPPFGGRPFPPFPPFSPPFLPRTPNHRPSIHCFYLSQRIHRSPGIHLQGPTQTQRTPTTRNTHVGTLPKVTFTVVVLRPHHHRHHQQPAVYAQFTPSPPQPTLRVRVGLAPPLPPITHHLSAFLYANAAGPSRRPPSGRGRCRARTAGCPRWSAAC